MKRLILFSQPSPIVFNKLKGVLFPDYIKYKRFGYMPSDGADFESNNKYVPLARNFVEENQADFIVVDNSQRGNNAVIEIEKLKQVNILLISGGNTFKLLDHLRKSRLDKAIIEFWKRDGVVLAGFSAGAIVLTPSIETAKTGDPNEVDLKDFTGLGIVKFEVWPHYEQSQKKELDKYRKKTKNETKPIGNDEMVVIDEV